MPVRPRTSCFADEYIQLAERQLPDWRHELRADPTRRISGMQETKGHINWEQVFMCLIHPAKVAALEALAYLRQPLSAKELDLLLEGGSHYHHLHKLKDAGILTIVYTRRVRGTTACYFYFAGREVELDARRWGPELIAPDP